MGGKQKRENRRKQRALAAEALAARQNDALSEDLQNLAAAQPGRLTQLPSEQNRFSLVVKPSGNHNNHISYPTTLPKLEPKPYPCPDISQKMFQSYGGMTEIFNFFEPIQQLSMQILNRWMYWRGVERIQYKFVYKDFTIYYTSKVRFDKCKVFCYNVRSGRVKTKEDRQLNFENGNTLQIKDALYCFSERDADWRRYSQLSQAQIKNERLASSQVVQRRSALANVADLAIFMTGGVVNSDLSKFCHFYDIQKDRWNGAPNLNIARADHSSCTLMGVVYVFCGRSKMGSISSIESMDAEAEINNKNAFWTIIDSRETSKISGRQIPLVLAIGSNSIMIMGGYDEFAQKQDKNDVFIFNVQTRRIVCEQPALKLDRIFERGGLNCPGNQCAMIGHSLVVAHVSSKFTSCAIAYVPGDETIKNHTRI